MQCHINISRKCWQPEGGLPPRPAGHGLGTEPIGLGGAMDRAEKAVIAVTQVIAV